MASVDFRFAGPIGVLLLFAAVNAAGTESDHHAHPNHFAVFAGITTGGDDDHHGEEDAALTVGFDYERRLTNLVGIGVLGDWAFGDRRDWILAVPIFFHISSASKFLIAPGSEQIKGEGPRDDDREFLVRIGYAYEFIWRKPR
jgi:hypothetical protein